MGKHFTFGDSDGAPVDIKSEGGNNDLYKIDRGGGHFSFGTGRGRGKGDEDSRGRGGNSRGRGGGNVRGRGDGNFRGRGDGNFRGRGSRGNGNFRGRGRGGRFSKNFNDRARDERGEGEKEKLGVLSDELMAYYRQVSATVEAGFDDDDPDGKKNFLDNVFVAVKDEGVKVSQNQTVSHILEGLLPHSEPSHLRILFCEFCNHLPTVSFDRFASHVFQSLIQYIPDMYDDENLKEEEKDAFKVVVEKLCKFFQSEIKQFLTDTYGSHVLRSLLGVLGGVDVTEDVIRSHSSRNKRKDIGSKKNLQLRKDMRMSEKLSSDFKSAFDAMKCEVTSNLSDEATEHLTNPNFCLVLQTCLLIFHQSNTSEYQQIAQALIEKFQGSSSVKPETDGEEAAACLPDLVQDSVGSYLIEMLISLASESEIPKLYKKIFKGKLSAYALHPVANYVLQKLCLGLTNNPKCLTEIVSEITPYMEDILACNRIGVITKIAEACRSHSSLQKTLMQAVMKAFHCYETEEKRKKITPLIASMTVYEVFFPSETSKENEENEKNGEEQPSDKSSPSPLLLKTINIHGSLLLQQLVHFDSPKYVVTGLLDLTPAELSNLASDQYGSHVIEAFFNSPSVWARQKEEFVKKIKGFYINIACDKNGSRCLEGIWKGCAIKNKIFIAEELLKSRTRLESDRFGRFLWYNFNMLKFSTRQKDWINYQSGINKKEKLLQDILEGGSNKQSKSKKRQADDSLEDSTEITATPAKQKRKIHDKESPKKKEEKVKKNKKGKT